MERVYAVPAPGMKVRKPIGGHLKPEGEFVERDSYWLRREAEGDVTFDDTKKADDAAEADSDKSGRKPAKS